jgi:hypothetical protein
MVKMDPATIGLLMSIAPTVLDLLFGQGHIKESSRQQRYPLENMYGYGLEGYGMYGQGYRYPGRKRRIPTVETYFPPEAQPQLIKAAVFNRAIAGKNPWIQFLQSGKYFERIRNILKDVAEEYRKTHHVTEKQRKNLERQSTRLQAELNILQNELQNKALGKEFAEYYPGVDYDKLIKEKVTKLQNEINRIRTLIEASKSQPQVLVPQ